MNEPKKEAREKIRNKYNCRCAYCGNPITYKQLQVDHIKPLYRNDTDETLLSWGIDRGEDEESNYNPSCRRCNKWKGTFTLEQFREQISLQTERLERDSAGFRMAKDYNRIIIVHQPVVFYFEAFKKVNELRNNLTK